MSIRPQLHIGLAGAGMISPYHLKAWTKREDARVIAICDPDEPRARDRAKAFGVPSTYATLEDMLKDVRLDAVDIAAPVEAHVPLVHLAAAEGVHVLCQKPLALTVEAAEKLLKAVAGRVRLMVNENWRFRPYYRQAKEWIEAGEIGTIQSCSIAAMSSGLLADGSGHRYLLLREPWLQLASRLAIGELLIHHLDVVRWLFGPLRVLAARAGSAIAEVTAETWATILLSTADDLPVVVSGNMAAPGYPRWIDDTFEVVGTRSTLTFRRMVLEMRGKGAQLRHFSQEECYQEAFDAAVAHFVTQLRAGAPFETEGTDNLETLRLVEAAYLTAREDKQ